MKTCFMCKQEKSLSEFHWKNKKKGYKQSHCKPCQKEYRTLHYRNNKQRYIDLSNIRKKIFKDKIKDLKELTPCMDCKKNYPYYVMQFDHRNSEEKEYLVSRLANGNSQEKTWKEIEKCDIVCANCHAERTYQRLASKV